METLLALTIATLSLGIDLGANAPVLTFRTGLGIFLFLHGILFMIGTGVLIFSDTERPSK